MICAVKGGALVRHGRSALLLACAEGHLQVARALCDASCDVDARDELRRGALSLSVQRGDLVQLLLERGAKVGTQERKEAVLEG